MSVFSGRPVRAGNRWSRRTPPWLLAVYLFAIVGPTVVLSYLGLATVRRQHDAIASLEAVASRLRLEKLAEAFEAAVAARAGACLLDPRISSAVRGVDWSVPEHAQRARRALDAACAAHPICGDIIVVADDDGIPRLEEPLPRAAAPRGSSADGFSGLHDGERHETRGRLDLAMAAYRRVVATGSDAQARAVALSRLGGLQQQAGHRDDAVATWEFLARAYADTYDRAQRPQALVAALHLRRASAGVPHASPRIERLVSEARRDLAEGRWIISPAQAEYFLEQLGDPGASVAQDARPRLFRQFGLGRAVRRHLDMSGMPAPGVPRAFAITDSDASPAQVFATSVLGVSRPVVVAVAVDLTWLREALLPQTSRMMGGPELPGRVSVAAPSGEGVAFRQQFPFWSLVHDGSGATRRSAAAEALEFGGTIAGVLAVLVFGVALLVRDVSREGTTARLRSDLMNAVSHELRTPLSVIRLYAESLAGEFTASDPRAAQSRAILHESQRLGHLVDRVLEFSRVQRRPLSLAPELHDPGLLVRDFAMRYRPYLDHLGFDVVLDVADGAPPILVDAGALTQALVNLVDNAVKYADESPSLCLRVALVGPVTVAIDVEDQGPGIAPADRPHVLEAYYRGGVGDDRRGHGLGLHLVAAIMLAHGGDIEVGDAPAGGTRVRLLFPARSEGEGD